MNTGVHISFQIRVFSGYVPRSTHISFMDKYEFPPRPIRRRKNNIPNCLIICKAWCSPRSQSATLLCQVVSVHFLHPPFLIVPCWGLLGTSRGSGAGPFGSSWLSPYYPKINTEETALIRTQSFLLISVWQKGGE